MYSSEWRLFILDFGKKTLNGGACYCGSTAQGQVAPFWPAVASGMPFPAALPSFTSTWRQTDQKIAPFLLQAKQSHAASTSRRCCWAPWCRQSPGDKLPSCCSQLCTVGRLPGAGNALGGGLGSRALTGWISLISKGLAIAEDFDPLGSLSPLKRTQWGAVPQFTHLCGQTTYCITLVCLLLELLMGTQIRSESPTT